MATETDIPARSIVHTMQSQANFWDAYQVDLPSQPPSALHAYLDFTARTPKWIDALMTARNATVRPLKLKDVGKLANVPLPSSAADLRPGDAVGIFTIRSVCEQEVVLEILDSHLDVVLSVYRHEGAAARLTVSTLVFYHNRIGKLYMLPVAPMHKLVVRSILSNGATPR